MKTAAMAKTPEAREQIMLKRAMIVVKFMAEKLDGLILIFLPDTAKERKENLRGKLGIYTRITLSC